MASLTIDLDDIIDGLDSSERKELFDELSEEFLDTTPTMDGARTPTDVELQSTLLEIWERRDLLTPDQVSRIKAFLAESNIQ
jgi:hypothetical protein